MKFKENVDSKSVIHGDKIEKLFDKNKTDVCLELEKTIEEFWNVDRDSANFLNMMVKIKNSKSALEIGSSNGYSGIWIASALKETKGRLVTLEFWQKRMDLAIENFKRAGVLDIITPVVGDALEILADMKNSKNPPVFDFIFVDANKNEYIEYFKLYDSMLKPGGIIIADNILSHYKKTKDFVLEITENPNYQTQLLSFDAGMTLSIKQS